MKIYNQTNNYYFLHYIIYIIIVIIIVIYLQTSVVNGSYKPRELLDGGASAVNMKTGQPVFSLDIPVGGLSARSKTKASSLAERRLKLKKREKSTKRVDSLPELDSLQVPVNVIMEIIILFCLSL